MGLFLLNTPLIKLNNLTPSPHKNTTNIQSISTPVWGEYLNFGLRFTIKYKKSPLK